jgi:hypothetical protein
MNRRKFSQLFPLGREVITRNAKECLNVSDVLLALVRHCHGDWGDVCPADQQSNQEALVNGDRLLSAYEDRHGQKFWIITEADRSATTILLPEDY